MEAPRAMPRNKSQMTFKHLAARVSEANHPIMAHVSEANHPMARVADYSQLVAWIVILRCVESPQMRAPRPESRASTAN